MVKNENIPPLKKDTIYRY